MENEDTFRDLLPAGELVLSGDDAVSLHLQVFTGDAVSILLAGDHYLREIVAVDWGRALLKKFVGQALIISVHDEVGDVAKGGVESTVDSCLSDRNPQVPLVISRVDGGSEDVEDRPIESFDEAIRLGSVGEDMDDVYL